MLTVEELRSLLAYCPLTGKVFWRKNGKTALNSSYTNGYQYGRIRGKMYMAHRVIWALWYGKWPNGDIDHINHIKTDNNIANLRDVTHLENQRNKAMRHDNISGFNGVSWSKDRQMWIATIRDGTKKINLGRYADFHEAVVARMDAEKFYGYHPNHGL